MSISLEARRPVRMRCCSSPSASPTTLWPDCLTQTTTGHAVANRDLRAGPTSTACCRCGPADADRCQQPQPADLATDLGHCITIRERTPPDVLLVGESGIHSRDVERLQSAGIHAILVGESLMRSPDIGAKVDEILGR